MMYTSYMEMVVRRYSCRILSFRSPPTAASRQPRGFSGRKEANEQNTGKPFILPAMKVREAFPVFNEVQTIYSSGRMCSLFSRFLLSLPRKDSITLLTVAEAKVSAFSCGSLTQVPSKSGVGSIGVPS